MYPSCLATGCHILHQSPQTVHGPGQPEVWSMWHLQGAQKRMSQRKGKCSDVHMGGACVLHHQFHNFRWDHAETGEGWRWILSCERHSISHTNHGLQQRYGWSRPVRSAHSAETLLPGRGSSCCTSWTLQQQMPSFCTPNLALPSRCTLWHTKTLWYVSFVAWTRPASVPQSRRADHSPVPAVPTLDPGPKATKGRLKGKRCLYSHSSSHFRK